MLRSFLIYLSKADWAQRLVTRWKFAWKAASRFVAGEKIEDAIAKVEILNQKGINASLDHLGENTSTTDESVRATEEILKLITALDASKVRAYVSIKLTQIGLALDEALCEINLEKIIAKAASCNIYIRVDMEDTPYTDKTIQLYKSMRAKGYENIGLVVQSYLYRTETDVRLLLKDGTRLRLVKGAYKEPANLAYPKKSDVDANFDLITKLMIDTALEQKSPMLSSDGRVPPLPALGTHDEKRIEYGKTYASKVGLPKEAIEFQMLYGIRRDLQDQLANEGYPVRVYVPYGTHWYPYFMRRLAERPANVWFFISNFFRK